MLHALANQLVVVTAQGVPGDVGFFRLGQLLGHARVAWQVVHAQGHHTQGAGHQLLRVRAFAAMRAHVVHFTVIARLQPALQVLLVLAQLHPGDADMGKAELFAPILDRLGQCGKIGGGSRHGK
ncbi:hypothetical protein D3C81_1299560 [compost metagenome]